MRILITGAKGFIGSHLARALNRAGHDVIACLRTLPAKPDTSGIERVQADFADMLSASKWLPLLENIDVVINAVGIIRETGNQHFDVLHDRAPKALFSACATAGVRRVIQVSALGADETAFSHYHLSKRAADEHLRSLDLDWAVVMPSIVYGPGARSMPLFEAVAGLPLVPLVGDGEQAIQPIHVDDLTRAIVQLVEAPSALRADIHMVGSEPISMSRLFCELRGWLELGKARFVSLHYGLALQGAHWLGMLGNTLVSAETVQMLQRGNTADPRPFIERFGFRPRSMEQALADQPATQADRWHAGLYFLRPFLRISIAFVWLFTGIVSAFVYPAEDSYALLSRVGIEGAWQPFMLYGAAALDILFGIAVLTRFRLGLVVMAQVAIVLLYSVIITLALPEQWAHPFGPISKNIPFVMASLVMLILERR